MLKRIQTPLTKEKVNDLHAGDQVLITGTIYTARDAAHQRLIRLIEQNEPLPFDLQNQIIYYVGPTPTKPNQVFGSGGPTTSGRMDAYTPTLLALGLTGMIGKGYRQNNVIEAMKENHCVYFGAVGGAAAIIAQSVQKSEVIAFSDLQSEAIRKLEVVDFPCVVVIDCYGKDLYQEGKNAYLKTIKENK